MYCGVARAERHHDIAIIDEEGRPLARRRIIGTAEGLAELLSLAAEHGDCAEERIPVAIETGRGLLVACLVATRRDVYVINPMAAA